MLIRVALVLIAVLLAGCATSRAYSDATNAQERKSYVVCAVTRAFLNADHALSSLETARTAIAQCRYERLALYAKLVEENAGKPFSMSFIEAYMNELHATMLAHIALRLEQSNRQRRGDRNT